MSLVLIDTSVWIDFFSSHPKISKDNIALLKEIIIDGEACIIEAIRAELLSGHILPKLYSEISLAIDALDKIDLNWNDRNTWDDIITLAEIAKNNNLPIPGIIDRMILLCALNTNSQIASLDKSLLKLAEKINIKILLMN